MTYEDALTIINNALHSDPPTDTLWLNNKNLQSLPPEIGQLTALKTLRLDDNQLHALPPEICLLENLEYLDVSHNPLQDFPPTMFWLARLRKLNVYSCGLRTFPPALCDIPRLEKLKIWGNRFSDVPPEIGQLTHLRILELAHNPHLRSLPPEIGQLTELEELDVRGCPDLKTLPSEIGRLKKLRVIKVALCGLTSVPQAILRLPLLEDLEFGRNDPKPKNLVWQSSPPPGISNSRCWMCGMEGLVSQGRKSGVGSPASHTLDDDDPHAFIGDPPTEDFLCSGCHARFRQVGWASLRLISIPFLDLERGGNLTTDARHLRQEDLLWNPDTFPSALEALRAETWEEWKRRFWLRAAVASGNLALMTALIDAHTPLADQLSWAIVKRQGAAAHLLLDHGADPHENLSGSSLLAAKIGDSRSMDNFYDRESGETSTVFRLALVYRQFPLAERLLAHTRTRPSESDLTCAADIPLNSTVQPSQREIVRALLRSGCTGHPALHRALQGFMGSNWKESMQLLREEGVDFRAFSKDWTDDRMPEYVSMPAFRIFRECLARKFDHDTAASASQSRLKHFGIEAADAQGRRMWLSFLAVSEDAAWQMVQQQGYHPIQTHEIREASNPLSGCSEMPEQTWMTDSTQDLYDAVVDDDPDQVRRLLQAGADCESARWKEPLLHLAAQRGNKEIVALLLEHGCDPNVATPYQTALSIAALRNHIAIIRLLLDYGADPNNKKPLYKAIDNGHSRAAVALIEGGARETQDLDISTGVVPIYVGYTRITSYLVWALSKKMPDVALALVEHGADLTARDALPLAAYLGYAKVVAAMLTRGARSPRALNEATRQGHEDVMRLLLMDATGVELGDDI